MTSKLLIIYDKFFYFLFDLQINSNICLNNNISFKLGTDFVINGKSMSE